MSASTLREEPVGTLQEAPRELMICLLRFAASTRDAIATAGRYAQLLGEGWAVELEESAHLALMRVEIPPSASDALMLDVLREANLFGQAPQRLTDLGLASDVRYLGVWFDAHGLDAPRVEHEPRLHALLCALAERELAARPSTRGWRDRVRACIRERLASGDVDLISVARRFGVHPRKLSRLMTREGTTFQREVDEVRRARAVELLSGTDKTILQVASATGFRGKAPFHRAFRRWTQLTPREYRLATRGRPLRLT